jgi:hypothetical protein
MSSGMQPQDSRLYEATKLAELQIEWELLCRRTKVHLFFLKNCGPYARGCAYSSSFDKEALLNSILYAL